MSRTEPTREDLVRVLDVVFRRILRDGERTRTERGAGSPPWVPHPETDPLYEGLEPKDYDSVPYPPEQWTQAWRDAVMLNQLDDVAPLVDDALAARDLTMSTDTMAWRLLCRLSLVVASRAHGINARREWGDYADGWPRSADYRLHARHTLEVFVSLMDDLPLKRVTGEAAETFRDRLKLLPAMRGKGIYAGMSPLQALTAAERLRTTLWSSRPDAAQIETVTSGEHELAPHRGKNPFTRILFPKRAAKKESRLAGRSRTAILTAGLRSMLQAPLFLEPRPMRPTSDAETQLEQAKFWCVLIALHTGMRLGEIAMLRPGDFRLEEGVETISLTSDASCSFKSERATARSRCIPIWSGWACPGFARTAQRSSAKRLLPGAKDSVSSNQRGANISKWFLRWRRSIGVDSARTPFHAFRHTFETVLKAKLRGADTLIDQTTRLISPSSTLRSRSLSSA